jgi:hypothetical protein
VSPDAFVCQYNSIYRLGAWLSSATGDEKFFDGLFDRFTGFAGSLLNSTEQFLMLALDILEVVIRELGVIPYLSGR